MKTHSNFSPIFFIKPAFNHFRSFLFFFLFFFLPKLDMAFDVTLKKKKLKALRHFTSGQEKDTSGHYGFPVFQAGTPSRAVPFRMRRKTQTELNYNPVSVTTRPEKSCLQRHSKTNRKWLKPDYLFIFDFFFLNKKKGWLT